MSFFNKKNNKKSGICVLLYFGEAGVVGIGDIYIVEAIVTNRCYRRL